jgi:hypothetical protein
MPRHCGLARRKGLVVVVRAQGPIQGGSNLRPITTGERARSVPPDRRAPVLLPAPPAGRQRDISVLKADSF